jgi:hypothetical protein
MIVLWTFLTGYIAYLFYPNVVLATPMSVFLPISPATFVGSYTLWVAIIIGLCASIATLYYAYRLKGSLVSRFLWLFGSGMLLVVAGFVTVVVQWSTTPVQKLVHDILFIAGYILMLIGVWYVRKLHVS